MRCIKIVNCFFCFVAVLLLTSCKETPTNLRNPHVELVLRKIGDEFLHQLGNHTSRILPIKKDKNRYIISFEHELSFAPELLTTAARKIVEETTLPHKFIIETEKCSTKEVVHSFEMSNKSEDSLMVPCKTRPLPKDCYKVYFTFLDEANKPIPVPEQESFASSYFPLLYFMILAVLLLLSSYFIWKRSRKNCKITMQADWIPIGEFHFDKKGMKLMFKGKSEELSSKEADLLEMLHNNINETVNREHLLQVVWGDEGDYLGRTLDVYVSKIRKKLEADPKLKIINIRGVGYRLVCN